MAKEPTITDLKRWVRSHRTWKKCEPEFKAAMDRIYALGIFDRESAFAHFMGGCTGVLENEGSINRKDFLRLLNSSHEFAQRLSQNRKS